MYMQICKSLHKNNTNVASHARKASPHLLFVPVHSNPRGVSLMGCKCPILFFSSTRVPCVIKGLKKCSACSEIKKSVCQKRQCKKAIDIRKLANWGLDGHAGTESRSVHTYRAS